MSKPVVYLCGPINGMSDVDATSWRESFKEVYGGPTLDPMRRDYRWHEQEYCQEIVALDKRDIRHSDVVLARITAPSWGTAMEILYASEREIPVVLLAEKYRDTSPWLLCHSIKTVYTIEEAVKFMVSL